MKLLLAALLQHLHQNDAYIRELTNQINNIDDGLEMDNIDSQHAPPGVPDIVSALMNNRIEPGVKGRDDNARHICLHSDPVAV